MLSGGKTRSYSVSLGVLVEIVVDVVEVWRGRAVDVEEPVADAVELIEHRAVGAEEAVLLAGGQTPVPNLQRDNKLYTKSFTNGVPKIVSRSDTVNGRVHKRMKELVS